MIFKRGTGSVRPPPSIRNNAFPTWRRKQTTTTTTTGSGGGSSGLDVKKRLVILMAVSILALNRFIHWILLPTTDELHVAGLTAFHSSQQLPQQQQLSKSQGAVMANDGPASSTTSSTSNNDNDNNVLANALEQRQTFQSPLDPDLPKWISDYITWHRQTRAQYPGTELFTNPQAPNVLIRTCLGLCGGLHDRLGQLPWDLYLANQTRRVLFLRWYRPKPVEDFLIPNAFNWSMPPGIPHFDVRMQNVKHNIAELFDGVDDSHPEDDFWTTHLDAALRRATRGDYQNVKILRHRLLGHLNEAALEERLAALGETDMIHSTRTFGKIFFLFFHPAPAIEMELEDVYRAVKIRPGRYSAVHCRVRHPKAFDRQIGPVHGKWDKYPADKTGLPWSGKTREFAVGTATEAIECAKMLRSTDNPNEPIYFFSDSNDLVRYFSRELVDQTFVAANRTLLESNDVDRQALRTVQSSHLVARDVSMENTHIDRQKGRAPPAYYGTFVDLFLAINARCVTFGVGFYAVFATKISGTSCKQLYTEEAWGGSEFKALMANVCQRKKEDQKETQEKNQ